LITPVAPRRKVPWASVAGWLFGLALIVFLVTRVDTGGVWSAVVNLRGWLAVIVLWHACPLVCDVFAWQCVFPRRAPSFGLLFLTRWIGEGANALLPIPLLGEVLRIRQTRTAQHNTIDTTASVVADITLGLVTQVPFTAVGLILFGLQGAGDLAVNPVALLVPLALFVVAFYALQRTGALTRAATGIGKSLGRADVFDLAKLRQLEETLRIIYRRRGAVFAGLVWRLVGWVVGAGEIWIVLYALGQPIGFGAAIVLESLSQAARAVAFVIPAGLGVQDATLVALAAHYGVPAEAALSLALAKRFREVVLGLPALIVGFSLERHRRRQPLAQHGG
jgi:putative membrane protein